LYTTTSPIGTGVAGFAEGRKQRDDELYRQAVQHLAEANAKREAEQFASEKLGGFKKSKLDEYNNPIGYEDNTANIGQAVKRYPEAYLKVLQNEMPERPDPDSVEARQKAQEQAKQDAILQAKSAGLPTDPFLTPETPGAPASQPQGYDFNPGKIQDPTKPQPLLARVDKPPVQGTLNGEKVKVDPSLLQADSYELGKYIGNINGVDTSVVDPKKTGLNYDVGATAVANLPDEKVLPATPKVFGEDLPTAEQMAAIDRQRFSGQKDAIRDVKIADLPPSVRQKLGYPEGYQGTLDREVVQELIKASTEKPKDTDAGIDALSLSAIKSIEGGTPLSAAADDLVKSKVIH